MYSLFLAFRYIRKRIIVWLGMLSIAAAVVVFVVVMGVLEGFSERLKDMVRRTTSHVDISRPVVGGLADWQTIAEIVTESLPGHVTGVTPYVQGPALLQSQRYRFYGFIKGVDWRRELELGNITPYMRIPLTKEEIHEASGLDYGVIDKALAALIERRLVGKTEDYDLRPVYTRSADEPVLEDAAEEKVFAVLREPPAKIQPNSPTALAGSPAVIVGDRIWEEMELRRGEMLRTSVQAGFEGDMRKQMFTVIGVFKTGNLLFDHWALVNLADAQRLFEMPQNVHGLGVWLDDYRLGNQVRDTLARRLAEPAVVARIADEFSGGYRVRSWIDQQQDLFQAIAIENTIMRLIFVLFFGLIGVFILSMLYVMVSEKVRDIGILTAIGATRGGVVSIFLLDGLFVGVVGCLLGLLLGVWLAGNVNEATRFLHLDVFPAEVFHLERIPVRLLWQDQLLVAAVAVGSSVLASVYPALRAAAADPVESLRHE